MPRQYPVRTGPFIKDAEEQMPPMVQGNHMDRPRLPFAGQQGLHLEQTATVVQASTDNLSMWAGQHPDAARPIFVARQGLQITQSDLGCAFTYSMTQGNHPDQARPYVGPKGQAGTQVAQITHVPAPFSMEMSQGLEPSTPRLPFKPKYAPSEPLPAQQFDFTVEYYQGNHPDQPRLFIAQRGVRNSDGQVPSVTLLLFEESWASVYPTSPRLFTPPSKYASSYNNPAVQTDCTFEYVDVVGSLPYRRSLDISPYKVGLQIWNPDVVQQDIAMVQGVHADLPRLFLAPRIPLPDSQVTPISVATDSPEMWAGWVRDISHQWLPLRTGLQWLTPDVTIFDAAMTQGYNPSQPRLFLAPRIPLPLAQTTQVNAAFSPEMSAGYQPTSPRIFVFPKIGVQLSQPTPITTFSIEMVLVEGRAEKPRLWLPVRVGKAGWHPEVLIPFDAAMTQGVTTPKPRLFLAPRIPLPFSQTTQVSAPFSAEMVVGSIPTGSQVARLFIKPRLGLQVGQGDLFVAASSIFGPFLAASPTFTLRVMADKDFQVPPTSDESVDETLDN